MASGGAAVRSPVAARLHPVLRAAEVAIAGYAVLAVFVVAFGALLTGVLVDGWLGQFDRDVVQWMAERRTPMWNTLSLVGSQLAGEVMVPVAVAGALIVFAFTRRWVLFGIVAIGIALEGLTYLTATYFIVRTRPNVPRLEDLVKSDSYFSGHTAAAVVLYGSAAIAVFALTQNRVPRTIALTLAVLVPIAVACSRMYRGMHYPSDALAGALVGLGCVAVAVVAVRRATRLS
jgi:membrane-associated phospholipid phosphatase